MIGYAVFLKNKEARIKIVKTKKEDNDEALPTVNEILNPDTVAQIEETGKRWLKYIATTVVVTVGAIKVIDVLGDIAVKRTPSADNEE
jgi:hypothetical protein